MVPTAADKASLSWTNTGGMPKSSKVAGAVGLHEIPAGVPKSLKADQERPGDGEFGSGEIHASDGFGRHRDGFRRDPNSTGGTSNRSGSLRLSS